MTDRKRRKMAKQTPEQRKAMVKGLGALARAKLDPTLRIDDAQDEADEDLENYRAMLARGLVTMPTDGSTLQ